MKTFGSEFTRLRKLRGLTQKAVADTLGVDTAYMSRVATDESYSPTEDRIAKIAAVLKLNEEERDGLFFAAGKIPPEVIKAMRRNPKLFTVVRWADRRHKYEAREARTRR